MPKFLVAPPDKEKRYKEHTVRTVRVPDEHSTTHEEADRWMAIHFPDGELFVPIKALLQNAPVVTQRQEVREDLHDK